MSALIDIKELSSMAKNFKPGSTILLKDGIYTDLNVKIETNGAMNQKIYIKPQNPGKVIIRGSSSLSIIGSYITICNLVLKEGGSKNPTVHIKGNNNRMTGWDVSLSASSIEQMIRIEGKENRVDHNVFRDWNKSGVWVVVWRPNKTEDFALIDHNIFKNRIATGSDNGLECVRIGTSTDSLTSSKSMVLHNQFINCNGEIEIISNKSGDNIYYKNYIESCEGTLTLRHGNNGIVYQNHFEQNGKENSGGIRITGESHLVANNLLRNINGNGTTRTGISINNGVKDTPLNGYFQVKNTQIKNNVFVNCSEDYAIGVQVKSECVLKPINSEISGTFSYHSNDGEAFSTDSKCLGSDDIKYNNNVFYTEKMGDAPDSSGIIKKKPTELDIALLNKKINELYVATREVAGPNWQLEPENTDINIPLSQYYFKLKDQIIDEIANYKSLFDATTDGTPDNTAPDDTPPDNTEENTESDKITIDKARYDELIKIEENVTKIISEFASLQAAINKISPSISDLQNLVNN